MAQSHGVLIASSAGSGLQSPQTQAHDPLRLDLLKNFPFASDVGQSFFTDWVRADSQFQNADIHVHCQTLAPAAPAFGLGIKILSSFDTVESYQVGSNITVTAVGSYSSAVTSNLGPWIRVDMHSGEVVPLYAVLSVWLQLKRT